MTRWQASPGGSEPRVGATRAFQTAVVGATGFVGRAVRAACTGRGHAVRPVAAPRVRLDPSDDPAAAARRWIDTNRTAYDGLVNEFDGCDAVVNAAGRARPDSGPSAELFGANAAVPGLLARAAADAGVRRLVHVSSAAVQGSRDPLDEEPEVEPLTPYGDSKAAGERLLLSRSLPLPPEVVIYRPTSVQAAERGMTRQLMRVASWPLVPVGACGEVAIPLTLIENVAAGVALVAEAQPWHPIVLQPWEGMTTRRLFEAFGSATLVSLPRFVIRSTLRVMYAAGTRLPLVAAAGRRFEMLALGQGQNARALSELGFVAPRGPDGYARLAAQLRLTSGSKAHHDHLPADRP